MALILPFQIMAFRSLGTTKSFAIAITMLVWVISEAIAFSFFTPGVSLFCVLIGQATLFLVLCVFAMLKPEKAANQRIRPSILQEEDSPIEKRSDL